jgi:hypothetical protein
MERSHVGFTPRRFSGLGGRHDLSPHNSTAPTSRTGHTVRRQALHFLVLVHRFIRGRLCLSVVDRSRGGGRRIGHDS